MPKTEEWNDLYNDGEYDLVVLDEYKGQKTIQCLNSWLSNDPQPISRRGKAPAIKMDKLPFIILSNYTPREAYSKCSPTSFDALISRLKVIEFKEGELIRLEPFEQPSLPTEEDENLPIHPIFTEPESLQLIPTPPPLPDPLDTYLCSTQQDFSTGEYLLSSEYRKESAKRIHRAEEKQQEKKKTAVKKLRTRSFYKFFDNEASCSDSDSEDSGIDAFDLSDPFIDDS